MYSRFGIKTLLLAALISTIFSCKKDEIVISYVPEIQLLGIEPLQVIEFQEKIYISLSYLDGDGNIGYENPDTPCLFVKDSRLAEPDSYHLPPLSPVGSDVSIQGNLEIELKNTFVLGNSQQEQVEYEIYLEDRSGNRSNLLSTPIITITKL